MLTLIIPVAIFTTALFTLYSLLLGRFDPFHLLLLFGALLALAASAAADAARRDDRRWHRHRGLRSTRRDPRLRDDRPPPPSQSPRIRRAPTAPSAAFRVAAGFHTSQSDTRQDRSSPEHPSPQPVAGV
ncbi:hypothetical protein [Jiangella rhizosphaerae]|uniref:hypothetical protein n=1 Tax=Jiangella rhizosphaerae TaxID=2293569 RepID=UPI0011C48788|nr:hypothetical protein [Jiangella rhizosphaerae]